MGAAGPDIADIDFDDLTSPVLTDVQRQVLEFTEAKRVELDIDRMLAEAIDQAGVGSDLDDADGFGDRLSAHIAAIEADDGLRELTRSTLRQHCHPAELEDAARYRLRRRAGRRRASGRQQKSCRER